MTSFCNERGITFITGVPYHPQGQKGVEVHFRTIIDMVITTLGSRHTTWAQKDLVDELIYTLNTSLCTSIQITSHEALFGRPPRTSVSSVLGTPFVDVLSAINLSPERWQDAVHFHHQQLHALQDLIALGSSAEQLATKAAYDARPRPAVYNIGDWVLILYSTHAPSEGTLHRHAQASGRLLLAHQANGHVSRHRRARLAHLQVQQHAHHRFR